MRKSGAIILALTLFAVFPLSASAQQQKAPQTVIVTQARSDNFTDSVEALGTLRANETVTLTATVTETVTAVNFEDNQRVEAGDILVEMMSAQEKAEVEAERATLNEAKRQLDRIKPLVAEGASSKSILDQRRRDYESARARLEAVKSGISDRIITAPFSGVVGLRNTSVGMVLQPGTRITTLDDDSVMKLDFAVPSVFLTALKPELEIVATSKSFPGREFKGTISSIDSQIDPNTRSIMVRAIIPNEDRVLMPGLLMSVEILKNPREAIVIPEEAIVPEARKNFVFVATQEDEGAKVAKREVELGSRRPGEIEVLKGLKEGERIVTHGTLNITDGAAVTIKAEQKEGEPLKDILAKGDEKKKEGSE
jgi:membrane fusion protein (multidrug efflux system)